MYFAGLRAICLNTNLMNTQTFQSIWDPKKWDIMIPFNYSGKTNLWTVSLYTTHSHIDCSCIAKERGGGGHKKAAGFIVNTEQFSLMFMDRAIQRIEL